VADDTKTVARTGPLAFIRNPEDFWGGLALILMALFAWWATRTLPGQSGFAFGPGTAPRLFMVLLTLNGLAIMATGIFTDGNDIHYSWKSAFFVCGIAAAWLAVERIVGAVGYPGAAPLVATLALAAGSMATIPVFQKLEIRGVYFITLAVLVFAVCIRPLGLVISTYLLVIISSAATHEVKWIQTLIWGAILAAFCAVLFPYVLNLPMQLWPPGFIETLKSLVGLR
jgi:putative tricarboxylic transport membrane protein